MFAGVSFLLPFSFFETSRLSFRPSHACKERCGTVAEKRRDVRDGRDIVTILRPFAAAFGLDGGSKTSLHSHFGRMPVSGFLPRMHNTLDQLYAVRSSLISYVEIPLQLFIFFNWFCLKHKTTMTSFFITSSNRWSESSANASGRSSSTSGKIRKSSTAGARKNSGTPATSSSTKALTFDSSFATVSTANSSSASLDASYSTTSFADESSHSVTATRRVSFRTAFFADSCDSSTSSLTLDDIAEADDEADHSRNHHTKEDLQAGSSSLPLASLNETSGAEEGPSTEEQRQAKRHAAFLLKPRKKELHHFVFAAEIEAELDDYDSDDDFDEDQVSGRQS